MVTGARADHLGALVDRLSSAGASVEAANGGLRVRASGRPAAVDITTLPFPGFPTDLQAQMTAMMAISRGVSVITEKIYPERFLHVPELRRMKAQITLEGHSAIVKGVEGLGGAPVAASDLRASAALVLAGLVADTHTDISGVEHMDRGYEALVNKLASLGARIRRERA